VTNPGIRASRREWIGRVRATNVSSTLALAKSRHVHAGRATWTAEDAITFLGKVDEHILARGSFANPATVESHGLQQCGEIECRGSFESCDSIVV
jgi:hypothetical protein